MVYLELAAAVFLAAVWWLWSFQKGRQTPARSEISMNRPAILSTKRAAQGRIKHAQEYVIDVRRAEPAVRAGSADVANDRDDDPRASSLETRSTITLTLNGVVWRIENPSPQMTLLAWLRDEAGLTGAKVHQGPGVVTTRAPFSQHIKHLPPNKEPARL